MQLQDQQSRYFAHAAQQSDAAGLLPVVFAMKRVERPVSTPRHPLAGLWRSTGMLHTSIMSVRYDFSGPAARIVANEVGCSSSRAAHLQSQLAADTFLPTHASK